jgi:hypothetical protein
VQPALHAEVRLPVLAVGWRRRRKGAEQVSLRSSTP